MQVCAENKRTSRALPMVGMGQITLAEAPDRLIAVLGSCIGVAMYDGARRVGALAHVVMADSHGKPGQPGKFADTAVPAMVMQMIQKGARPGTISARLFGGASMFGSPSVNLLQIGENNLAAVQRALQTARIPVLGLHVGGSKGRRIEFDCETGRILVEIAGLEVVTL